ncbi:HD domain-containing protein [Skermanella mucosa]|uniref:HD domain-containing protein n=1 Tax=Skermanella mucosa TaxID=1789672 RepID=UPI00192BFCB8|nr:HD domain-containing protein [Skermanella mucosa]UEM22071.1 HD domain-containing protein [Skermanella mucosa]
MSVDQSLLPLLREINDLKRVRAAGIEGTLAARAFRRAWGRLAAGDSPATVALRETALAVAAARLGGIDRAMLTRAGLDDDAATGVLRNGFDAVAGPVDPILAAALRDHLGEHDPAAAEPPAFVHDLERQPRAGATRPGHPRLVLEPPESHADHCFVTAVTAALVSPSYGADPAAPFLAGLCHHFHNATLPDSGFAGEVLLGDHLDSIIRTLTYEVVATLPDHLAHACEQARKLLPHAETPEARAFHAGDVIDRILQMDHYARAAGFELRHAVEEMELVHAGPLQDFQTGMLRDVGLMR